MIDRIVHHADVLPLKGNSYRMRDTRLTLPSEKTENKAHYATNTWPTIQLPKTDHFSTSADTQNFAMHHRVSARFVLRKTDADFAAI